MRGNRRALSRGELRLPFTAAANPQTKFAHVRALRERGIDVAMVGDGVNDVPGLAAATVSITPADGADLAKSHSDAILLTAGIGGVARAIRIARRTRTIIRQNLCVGRGVQPDRNPARRRRRIAPWLAALGMSASSLGVTLNALRLASDDTAEGDR